MYNMIYDLLKQSLPAKSVGGAALRTVPREHSRAGSYSKKHAHQAKQ